MNNSYAMSASFEARKNSQAAMITAAFAAMMILLMFLVKWSLPVIVSPIAEESIEVNLNIPDEPPAKVLGGGGGGGNNVVAPAPAGVAPHTPPDPGVKEDSRDPETDETDKTAPEVKKPVNPKPVEKVVENTSPIVKATPKAVVETPAPPRPKAVLGHTTAGNSNGGNEATSYERNGGRGPGTGVGTGPGYGGNTGGGNGGGNGTGSGTGNGPKRVSGNRFVINPKNMDAGENLKGKVFAEISVSPDGIGTFVRTTRGSTYTTGEAIEIIREWLRRNRFDKKNEESTVVYEFNFIMGG
jgi:outer membrane biosynthesis protein TonB